jgi:alcohol dehydrogenase class IV
MAFNEPAIADAKLCRVEPFVGAMRELAREKSAQLKAPQVRMEEHDLPLLAELASVNVNSTTNPRPYTRDDIMAIARLSFHVVHGTAAEPEKR